MAHALLISRGAGCPRPLRTVHGVRLVNAVVVQLAVRSDACTRSTQLKHGCDAKVRYALRSEITGHEAPAGKPLVEAGLRGHSQYSTVKPVSALTFQPPFQLVTVMRSA